MSRIQKKQYRWFTLLTVLAVVVGGLWVFNPATQATAATQYLGGYTRTDDLRIQVLDNGRIGVERYTSSGSWERQIYATTSKGSRLYWSGGNVGLGYFSGSSPTLAYNNVSSTQPVPAPGPAKQSGPIRVQSKLSKPWYIAKGINISN
jgi:hypothetical protein